MAWENYNVEQQRIQLVQAYMNQCATMTSLCQQYGISRKTAYKWYNRFLEFGEEGLKDLSRAPHKQNSIFTDLHINLALDLKMKKSNWGPKKIIAVLKRHHPEMDWFSPTRLYEIFKNYHLVKSRKIKGRVPATSPLGDHIDCNDTWGVDFKGWFLTGDDHKCEPLTITDCFSRYLIKCTLLEKHTINSVWSEFDKSFREYGLPKRLRSDNGPPFGSVGAGRLTGLSVNLIKAGVVPEWIEPGHPEQNGRHERFHLTLKQEIADPPKANLQLQLQAIEEFKYEYNFERPHEALSMNTPASNYQSSNRIWNGKLCSPEYGSEFIVRKTEKNGQISWKGSRIYISEALGGEPVGLKIVESNNIECHYGPIYLGILDQNGNFIKPQLKKRRQR